MMQHIELRQAERDRAYADLKQIKDHLEERVAQRTEELTAANRALAAENAKLQQAEAALSRALTEKETLLREIHHRVKNNLQVIYSLLSLQIQDKTDEQSRLLLEDARQRVKTMALVHETLYGSADLARVSARHFLQDVTSNLLGIYHGGETGISLEVSADDVSLDIDQAIPLGLIVNELATNALKHAFRGRSQGHIEITLQRSAGDELVLQISDDGIGMGAGEGPRPSGSLGLKLVEALAQQLRGEVQVSQAVGTRFSIRFRTTA
jgi:two-component sensor histidine kinase